MYIIKDASGANHHRGKYYKTRQAAKADRDALRAKGTWCVISRAADHPKGESIPNWHNAKS